MNKKHPIKDFLGLILGTKKFHSHILSATLNLKDHSKIKFKATNELEEYIINILTRKALLSQGCSIYNLKMHLSTIIELVIWYTRALSMIERLEVTPKTLSTAIRVVDNYYITNPEFIKRLQSRFIGLLIKILG
jgi:hypothetical protein